MNQITYKKINLITIKDEKFSILLPININFVDFNNILYKKCKIIQDNIANFYFVKYLDINNNIITNDNFNINNCDNIKVIFVKMPVKRWL